MISEISKSLKAFLYERTTSPLMGSILFFWVLFNWEGVVYFLLSGSNIEAKLEHIELNYKCFYTNFLYPVLVGGAASLLYPIVSEIPFWISEHSKNRQRKLKRKLGDEALLTLGQSLALRDEISQQQSKYQEILDDAYSRRLAH